MRDSDDIGSNPTDNPHLDDLIRARVNRRQVLGGGLAAAAVSFFGGSLLAPPAVAAPGKGNGPQEGRGAQGGRPAPLGFAEVPTSTDDTVHVPEGYLCDVLIPWGTPLLAGAPAWKPDASNTAADQAKQVGFNHDGMHFFPFGIGSGGNRRGLLVLNHEYTDDTQIYTATQGSAITNDAAGREKVAKALAAHGVTVVEIRQTATGTWLLEQPERRAEHVESADGQQLARQRPERPTAAGNARDTPCRRWEGRFLNKPERDHLT